MTDEHTPNEDELRRLLGSADRPRALSDDELVANAILLTLSRAPAAGP